MIRYRHSGSDRQFTPIQPAVRLLLATVVISTAAIGDNVDSSPSGTQSAGDAVRPGLLQKFNALVGSWRGIGQPKRGSRRGAWQEKTVCRWDFSADQPAIRFDAEQGRQFERLTMTVSSDGKELVLHQHIRDEPERVYRGQLPDGWPAKVQLVSAPADDGSRVRCTIEQLSEIRLIMLFERQATLTAGYRRVAGIGYTRSGQRLAQAAGNQRECIVTGGQGTMTVQHKGKTWYVCCEGCRQAFEDAPDEIIADYLSGRK